MKERAMRLTISELNEIESLAWSAYQGAADANYHDPPTTDEERDIRGAETTRLEALANKLTRERQRRERMEKRKTNA